MRPQRLPLPALRAEDVSRRAPSEPARHSSSAFSSSRGSRLHSAHWSLVSMPERWRVSSSLPRRSFGRVLRRLRSWSLRGHCTDPAEKTLRRRLRDPTSSRTCGPADKTRMAFGVNRKQALCDTCGHPSMAHLGSACYCGCNGMVLPPRRPMTRPGPRRRTIRRLLRPTPEEMRAPVRQPVLTEREGHPAPVRELVAFVKDHLSATDSERFLCRVSNAHGQPAPRIPVPNPWDAISEFFVAHVSISDTERYLAELRRRKLHGEALLRTHRLDPSEHPP